MNPLGLPVDLDEIKRRNGVLMVDLVKLMFRGQGDEMPPDIDPNALWKGILEGVGDVASLGAEVERLRAQRQQVRDLHAPMNSSGSSAPGAVCTGCSVHGTRVAWPCVTWSATEDRR